jgi:hypothetical protein
VSLEVYQAKLAERNSASGIASRAKRSRALITKYGVWLEKYRGGLPIGVLAAIMEAESGGKMEAPGDVKLDEVGFYQITKHFPPSVGVDPGVRYDLEGNIFLGSLEYQIAAVQLAKDFPRVVVLGSEDNWKLARLDFAVGSHGARRLIQAAIEKGLVQRGKVYAGIVKLVDTGGAFQLSTSQPADKVWYRVHFVDNNFVVGSAAAPGGFGLPKVLPSPSGVRYQFPSKLKAFLASSEAPSEAPLPKRSLSRFVPIVAFAGFSLIGLLVTGIAARFLNHDHEPS